MNRFFFAIDRNIHPIARSQNAPITLRFFATRHKEMYIYWKDLYVV